MYLFYCEEKLGRMNKIRKDQLLDELIGLYRNLDEAQKDRYEEALLYATWALGASVCIRYVHIFRILSVILGLILGGLTLVVL